MSPFKTCIWKTQWLDFFNSDILVIKTQTNLSNITVVQETHARYLFHWYRFSGESSSLPPLFAEKQHASKNWTATFESCTKDPYLVETYPRKFLNLLHRVIGILHAYSERIDNLKHSMQGRGIQEKTKQACYRLLPCRQTLPNFHHGGTLLRGWGFHGWVGRQWWAWVGVKRRVGDRGR